MAGVKSSTKVKRTKEQRKVDSLLKVPTFLKRKVVKGKKYIVEDEPVSKWTTGTIKKKGQKAFVSEELQKSIKEYEKKYSKKKNGPKLTPQQHIRNQVGELIGEIEGIIDEHINSGLKKPTFKMYDWLRLRGIKGPQTLQIINYYTPQVNELLAVPDMEKEEKDSFSWMNPRQFQNHLDMMQEIVTDSERWASNTLVKRRPRIARPQTADKQVRRLKYMKNCPNFKIVSVEPSSIVGASQLWVFNTKKRQLGVYDAVDRGGFKIKGSTIKNWEPSAEMKKVRKPMEVLPVVLEGGKVKLRKLMDSIKAKSSKMTGRINKHCVLLKVVRE